MPSKAEPEVIFPNEIKVASLFTMIPAFCKPMNAMNKPIPAPMALRRLKGNASTIFSRKLVTVSRMNMIPSKSTAVKANCQV